MTRSPIRAAAAAALLLLTACGSQAAPTGRANAGLGQPSPSPSAASTAPSCEPFAPFDAQGFGNSAVINNQWFPLVPGTQLIFTGRSEQDRAPSPHRVEFTVTGLTKMVNEVRTRVITDRDLSSGSLDEQELTFFAQDKIGNVWSLGEYPEDFENGKFVGAPDSWIAGSAGAEGGVQMPATSKPGTPPYRQGFAPGIKFLDCAKTLETGQKICEPSGCYDNVLLIDEWSPLDPDSGHQRKYYAPAVGVAKSPPWAIRKPRHSN